MDRLRDLLNALKTQGKAKGNFLGLLNVFIGRQIQAEDDTPVSQGLTWRELAALLKRVRWEKEAARELGLDPANLPPRDRQKFWYTAIAQADVGSPKASKAGDEMARKLASLGYKVGPAPHST
jgi:hypothetical protein